PTVEPVANPKGRAAILRGEQLRELVEVALSSPAERGLPFSNWSVPKLTEYCREKRLSPPVSDEWVRRLLRREGLTAQRIRTWKISKDPDLDRKKNGSEASTEMPAGAGRSLFRRMGTLGTQAHGRRGLGAAQAPAAQEGHLPPAQGDRTVSGLLRCPRRLPERHHSPGRNGSRTSFRLS